MLDQLGERDEKGAMFVDPQAAVALLDAEQIIAGRVFDLNAGADRQALQTRAIQQSAFTFLPPLNSQLVGSGRQQVEQSARRLPAMRPFGSWNC